METNEHSEARAPDVSWPFPSDEVEREGASRFHNTCHIFQQKTNPFPIHCASSCMRCSFHLAQSPHVSVPTTTLAPLAARTPYPSLVQK